MVSAHGGRGITCRRALTMPIAATLIVVAIGLVFRLSVIARPTEVLTARYLADDYFYYLSVAANIAQGAGSSFDGGLTSTNGYQPLFLWLLAGVFWLGATKIAAIHAGLVLQAVAAAAGSLLILALPATRGTRWTAAGASALLSLNLFFVLPTLTGFEMALALAAMLLAIAAWHRSHHPLLVGALCGLSVLARVDTVVVPAVLCAGLVVRRRFRDLVPFIAGAVMVAGPLALWNAVAFGHPLPDSGVIKAHYRGIASVVQASSTAFLALPRVMLPGRVVDWGLHAAPWTVWVAAGAVLVIAGRAAWRVEHRELAAIAGALTLSYLVMIDALEAGALVRYLFPVWAIVAIFVARSVPAGAIALLFAAHALDVAVYARWDRTTPPAPSYVGVAHTLAPAEIDRTVPPGQVLGSFDAGALGYFSPRAVINLDGLANHDIVQLRRDCPEPYDRCVRDYLRSKRIGVLAGGTAFGWTRLFPDWAAWDRLYESPPLVDGSRLVLVRVPP